MTTQIGLDSFSQSSPNRKWDEPTIIRETKYDSKDYKVAVGFVKEGEIPQYLVINKETGVIEFNNEVLSFVREWMVHFQERLDLLNSGKKPTDNVEEQYEKSAFN